MLLTVLVKVFAPMTDQWQTLLWIVTVSSIAVANLFAIRQKDLKRFMAFSSISQAGYIMLAVIGGSAIGMTSLVFYVLVSMAASLTLQRLREMAGLSCPILRIMPNTPCAVGKGLTLVSANSRVTAAELADFKALMAESGLLADLPEHLIDAARAVSGCGPAYAYMFVEALADGAGKCGVPRAKAMRYAAQMLLGSASLLLETGEHPGALKDAVCSPGGSTIAGVAALEDRGFRGAAIAAVEAAYRRTKELG